MEAILPPKQFHNALSVDNHLDPVSRATSNQNGEYMRKNVDPLTESTALGRALIV